MRLLIVMASVFLPWSVRRLVLKWVAGYELHPSSRIGFSIIAPRRLVMKAGSVIGHLNVCKGLDLLEMGEKSTIARLNWITGFPSPSQPGQHFHHQTDRRSELILADGSGITSRHLIDCTNSVTIGRYGNIGGFRCQVMTHAADLIKGRQSSAPISIGAYSLVGTNCVLLGGSKLPDYSVLSASSLLNKSFEETHMLYAGVPARPLKPIPADAAYFTRVDPFII